LGLLPLKFFTTWRAKNGQNINNYRYGIKPQNIVGHADIAPDRKSDPSGYFDWKKFYAFLGVYDGLFDSALTEIQQREVLLHSGSTDTERILKLQQDLAAFGYRVIQTGVYDLQTQLDVEAFNRHFSPEVFIKEEVLNRSMIQNPENQKWFGISQERLDFLLSNRKI
jgi:N-acetyl-anhydromuramyl-L-alanine amidase AmpD